MDRILKKCLACMSMILLLLTGCREKNAIEALPFQNEEDGKWQMVRTDGKLIENTDYESAPTVMTNGRYWVKNSKCYYELYSDDSSLPIVDAEYRYVSLFANGKAIVAKRDENVSIIDRKGEVVADLSKVGPYVPDQFSGFNGEVVVFTYKEKNGVCNMKGEVVLKPVYSMIDDPMDGKIVALDSIAFNSMMEGDSIPKGYGYVFDYGGKELLKISRKKYKYQGTRCYGDYLAVGKDSGETGEYDEVLAMYGIINIKGEEVVKPNKKYHFITDISEDNFVYFDGEKWGVNAIKGGKILPSKYYGIEFAGDFIIAISSESEETYRRMDPDDMEYQLFDKTGKLVLPKKYMDIKVYGDNIFVQTESNRWLILDKKGKPVKEMPKIYNVDNFSIGDLIISTDKINIDNFVKNLDFSSDSMDGLTFQSSVQNVLKLQAESYSSTNQPKAADYNYTDNITIFRRIDGAGVTETITFPEKLSHQNYRNEQVIDFWIGWTYYYHINKVPTGYSFTTKKPKTFSMTFDNYGILRGKLKTLYKALCKKFGEYGTEEDHNGAATLFKLAGGKYALVALEPHNVTATWGVLSASEREIYKYYGNKEDLTENYGLDEGY